jgi:hypothetical protein
MSTVHIQGVGNFDERTGYWLSEPEQLHGAILSIESATISLGHETRAKSVCDNWESILATCRQFIEANRERYKLMANTFSEPNVFIESEDYWSVYFDTESEIEAVVGVNFKSSEPFQLIIGD